MGKKLENLAERVDVKKLCQGQKIFSSSFHLYMRLVCFLQGEKIYIFYVRVGFFFFQFGKLTFFFALYLAPIFLLGALTCARSCFIDLYFQWEKNTDICIIFQIPLVWVEEFWQSICYLFSYNCRLARRKMEDLGEISDGIYKASDLFRTNYYLQ